MVIKLGLWSLPPFLAAGIRFFLAFTFLSVFAFTQKLQFPRDLKSHLFFFWFGLVNFTGGYAFVYWGQQYIDSGLASVLFSVMPFYVLILSIWMLPDELINFKKIIGVSIGFIGVVTIFWDRINFSDQQPGAIYGMIALILGPWFASFGTIAAKRIGKSMHPTVLVTLPMFYAAVSFLLISFLLEKNARPIFDFNAIFSLIYLSLFGTSIAFVLYFWMLKHSSAVIMSMITFINPPMALFWGWLIFDEYISILLLIGMILILTGIFIVRKNRK
jgi:drug/metabolite transporter (DMT)-like permease